MNPLVTAGLFFMYFRQEGNLSKILFTGVSSSVDIPAKFSNLELWINLLQNKTKSQLRYCPYKTQRTYETNCANFPGPHQHR